MSAYTEDELREKIFGIISFAGEAKSIAQEALNLAEKGDFDKAEQMMKDCKESLLHAHRIQTELIQKEAAGEHIPLSMLFVHAQDHLMGAMSEKGLIERLIILNKRLYNLENK